MSEQVIKEIIGRRSFVLITGASRGFGRSLALEMGKVVGAGSTLLLMARNKDDLEATKVLFLPYFPLMFLYYIFQGNCPGREAGAGRGVRDTRPGHRGQGIFSKLFLPINIFLIKETLERSVKANYGSADHEVAIIIQNAGTIGQNGRKITVSTKQGLIRIQITVPQRSFAISGAYRH